MIVTDIKGADEWVSVQVRRPYDGSSNTFREGDKEDETDVELFIFIVEYSKWKHDTDSA